MVGRVQSSRKSGDILVTNAYRLMDIYMPILSGLYATIAIRALDRCGRHPVILGLLSGCDEDLRSKSLEAGMDG